MKRSSQFAELFRPWAGLAVAIIAGAIVHQYGSEGVFNACRTVSPVPLLLVSAVGLLACAVSGWVSWKVARNGSESAARQVAGVISAGTAALFIMAILLPMIAAVVLPPCFE